MLCVWGGHCVSQNPRSRGPRLGLGTRDVCMRFGMQDEAAAFVLRGQASPAPRQSLEGSLSPGPAPSCNFVAKGAGSSAGYLCCQG